MSLVARFSHGPNPLPSEANAPVGAATTAMECAGSTCDNHAHAVLCSATVCPAMVLKAPLLAAVHGMPPSQVACMTHHVAGLGALAAVKRREVAMEDAMGVETVGTPEAWADLMKRYVDTLAAGEATPVPEEDV